MTENESQIQIETIKPDIDSSEGRFISINFREIGLEIMAENSGGRWIWKQQFQPFGTPEEDFSDPKVLVANSGQYAYGLLSVLRFWENFENESHSFPRVDEITGKTNERMDRFRKKLLGDNVYKSEESITGGEFYYTLDLRRLSEDDGRVERLERLAKRATKK